MESAGHRDDPQVAWPRLESAIADIQLLGSPSQVALARQFAVDMAEHGTAPLDPLVNDLRNSLRKELQLHKARESVTYLRFVGGLEVSFDQTLQATIQSVNQSKIEQAAIATISSREKLEDTEGASQNVLQVIATWLNLESLIRERLVESGEKDAQYFGVGPLLDLALEKGKITVEQHRALRGLNAMRNLAVHGPEAEMDDQRTAEFSRLAEAMTIVLEITR